MKRSDLIVLAAGAAVSETRAASAQQPERMRRVGVLAVSSANDATLRAFRQELAALGWTEGRNVRFDVRSWLDRDSSHLRAMAAELVGLAPDVILTQTPGPTLAVKVLTHAIPIVFAPVADPVGAGFVANLARPGGNVTGFTDLDAPIAGKWLQLLTEISPHVKRVLVLFEGPRALFGRSGLTLGPSLGLTVSSSDPKNVADLEHTIAAFARQPAGALVVAIIPHSGLSAGEIVTLAARYHLPAIYFIHAFIDAGGLMFYGPDLNKIMQQAAGYVDRILRGAKPGDLPVQNPTKFDLAINLKTAKALGLAVPQSILLQATQVIR